MDDQKEPEGGPRELQQDALVEKLVADPNKTPDVLALVGFLGRSSEAGNWRLYLTPQLNSYVEFSAEDVVHTQPLATAQSPLGGTMVWLRRDTALKHTRTGTQQAQAEFVQGDIISSFMAGPGMQEMPLRGLAGLGPLGLRVSLACDSIGPWECPHSFLVRCLQ